MPDRLSAVGLRILGTRANMSELAAIDTSILKNGAAVYITSAKALFLLEKSATTTPDGTAVVAPVLGEGRWTRQGLGLEVLTQTEWAIDPVNGSDNAPGTPEAPLATGAEFTRRTFGRGLIGLVSLDIVNPFPLGNGDYILVNAPLLTDQAFLRIGATGTTVLAEGSVTSVANGAAGIAQTTIQSSQDLSGYVGKRLRITASATAPVGTIAYIEASSGGTTTLSAPAYTDTSIITHWGTQTIRQLGIGDTFVVEDLYQMPALYADCYGVGNFAAPPYARGAGLVDLQLCDPTKFEELVLGDRGRVQAYGCQIKASSFSTQNPYATITGIVACRFSTSINAINVEGVPAFYSCSFGGHINTASPTSQPAFISNNSVRGGMYRMDHSARAQINGLCFHEWAPISGIGAALHVQEGCFVNGNGPLWGSSTQANTYGIKVDAYAGMVYLSSAKPTVSGTLAPGKDVEVGGTSLAYADVPTLSANSSNFAAIVQKN